MASLYEVFLSHSSADKPAVEKLAHKLVEAGIKPFLDKWHLIPGEPWEEALEEALDQSRTCAVFVGPTGLGPWQNEEMRSALEDRVRNKAFRVIPVLLPGSLEPRGEKLPRFLRRLTWVDFRAGLEDEEAFHRLVHGIQGTSPGPGGGGGGSVPPPSPITYRCMAQPPEGFIHRSEYETVLEALCPKDGTARASPAVGITTALRGAGGFGKTALAQEICFDERIRQHYPDGILWTTMGDNLNPESRLSRILDLIRWWTDTEPPGFKDLSAAGAKLREILKGRRVLLVVDDVWSPADVTPFQGLGNDASVLITTRNSQTLPASSVRIEVDALASREAASLLRSGLPEGQENDFSSLAARLGEWPLLLKLVNRQLREMVEEDGLALADALPEIWQALESEGFSAFNRDDPEDRHAAADQALSVSLGRLSGDEQERFLQLAVFPEDADVPLAVLERFWGSGRFETQRFCRRLHDLSLLLRFDRQEGTVRLHDVFRQILIQRRKAELPSVHQSLLGKLKPASGTWADLPIQESYLWSHLGDHLRGAERESELRELLVEFSFLEAKLKATDVNAVISDYAGLAGEDQEFRLLQGALRLSADALGRDRGQLAPQLLGRLLNRKEELIQRLLAGISSWKHELWLRPRTASLTQPGGALIRILQGHRGAITAVAMVDRRHLVSASYDSTLRVWDLETGQVLHTLEGHMDWVTTLAVVDDRRAISGSYHDGSLRVWDLEAGRALHSFQDSHINALTVLQDRRAVSASNDGLKVWDLNTGQILCSLGANLDWITAVAVVDARRIISGSADGKLRMWDLHTGTLIRTFEGHTGRVNAVAMVDCKRVISASRDQTLRVWNVETGQSLQTLKGHTDEVAAIAVVDSQRMISASHDQSLRVWDLDTGESLHILEGHTSSVLTVALVDTQRAVSGSADRTLRLWDLGVQQIRGTLEGHTHKVTATVVLGRHAVFGSNDGILSIWDLETGQLLRTLEGHRGFIYKVVAVDARRVVSASSDRTLRVWDLETGQTLHSLEGHTDLVLTVAVVNGRQAISGSRDRTLRTWDLESGQLIRVFPATKEFVGSIAVADSGRVVSDFTNGRLRVWDLETGETLSVLEGHQQRVTALEWVDSRRVLSGSDDRTLRVWDSETGKTLHLLAGHGLEINAMAVMGGTWAVSASDDRQLRVWDLDSGETLRLLTMDAPVSALATSPDGRIVVAGDKSGKVHFFDWVVPNAALRARG